MVSPYALHQQQLAILAQQQSLLMAAAAKSMGGAPKFPINAQQPSSNGANLPTQNWPNMGYQIPGMMMQVAGNKDVPQFMQVDNLLIINTIKIYVTPLSFFHFFYLVLGCKHGTTTSSRELSSICNIQVSLWNWSPIYIQTRIRWYHMICIRSIFLKSFNRTSNDLCSFCCSMHMMGQGAPSNGVATANVSKPASASPATPPTQSGKDYDFSSLTQGMFSKPWVALGWGGNDTSLFVEYHSSYYQRNSSWGFFPSCMEMDGGVGGCKLYMCREAVFSFFLPFCHLGGGGSFVWVGPLWRVIKMGLKWLHACLWIPLP